MALSNMGREPRREWTEQLFGIVVAAIILFGYSKLCNLFIRTNIHNPGVADRVGTYAVGLVVLLIGFLILLGIWYLAHEIGELVCDTLASFRLDPRPKRRN